MTISESNFESDSDVFTPRESFLTYADSMATYFELNPDKILTITGHCDYQGSHKYNDDLGLRRAESAKKFLIDEKAIKVEIKVATKGKREPTSDNSTAEGMAKNRRVHFLIE